MRSDITRRPDFRSSSSASNLEKLTDGAAWLDGRRLNGSDSQDTVMEWVNSLGLDAGAE